MENYGICGSQRMLRAENLRHADTATHAGGVCPSPGNCPSIIFTHLRVFLQKLAATACFSLPTFWVSAGSKKVYQNSFIWPSPIKPCLTLQWNMIF